MMNEIAITHDPHPTGHAFILWSEVEAGLRRMHIIENYDDLRKAFRRYGLAPWINNRENYPSIESFSEDDMDAAIAHETIHCVVFDLEGRATSAKLNVLDTKFGLRDELRGLR